MSTSAGRAWDETQAATKSATGKLERGTRRLVGSDSAVSVVPRCTFKVRQLGKESDRSGSQAFAFGGVAVKKRIEDVDLAFYFTDDTIRNYEKLPNAIVSVERDFGDGVHGLLAYDVGSRNAKARISYRSNVEDVDITARGTWVQENNILHGEARVDLDTQNSLHFTYNMSDNPVSANYIYPAPDGSLRGFPLEPPPDPLSFHHGYTYSPNGATIAYQWRSFDGWHVQPFYDVARQAAVLTVGKRHGDHAVRAAYDTGSETVGLEWRMDPLRVLAHARVTRDGFADATAAVTLEKELEF